MAEWIEKEEVFPTWLGFLSARCSECGKYVCTPTINNEYFHYKYCPHCGSVIGTKEENEEKNEQQRGND